MTAYQDTHKRPFIKRASREETARKGQEIAYKVAQLYAQHDAVLMKYLSLIQKPRLSEIEILQSEKYKTELTTFTLFIENIKETEYKNGIYFDCFNTFVLFDAIYCVALKLADTPDELQRIKANTLRIAANTDDVLLKSSMERYAFETTIHPLYKEAPTDPPTDQTTTGKRTRIKKTI